MFCLLLRYELGFHRESTCSSFSRHYSLSSLHSRRNTREAEVFKTELCGMRADDWITVVGHLAKSICGLNYG